MANTLTNVQAENLKAMKAITQQPAFIRRVNDTWKDAAGPFLAGVLDLYAGDSNLLQCDAQEVMQEAMKAAVLHLPVVKSLGLAYVVPFRGKDGKQHPNFVLGYKGLIQLAMRTGQYRTINAGPIYEGETVTQDRITGETHVSGEPTSDKAIGYFAHFSLINGFSKTEYWTRDKVRRHAEAKSKSYKLQASPWHTDFDAMASKTLLRYLIGKYGVLSVDMQKAAEVLATEDEQPAAERPENLPQITFPAADPIPADAEIQPDTPTVAAAPTATPSTAPAEDDSEEIPF